MKRGAKLLTCTCALAGLLAGCAAPAAESPVTAGRTAAQVPGRGAAITDASHDLVCPGRFVVSGYARAARGHPSADAHAVRVVVRDADGTPLGEAQTEAGGGANWGRFVVTVPLTQDPEGETGTAELLVKPAWEWIPAATAQVRFRPRQTPGIAVVPDPARTWEPEAEEVTVMGAPLRAGISALEEALGDGRLINGRTYAFGNDAVVAHLPYSLGRAHRLVAAKGRTGSGVEVGQCAEEVAARLGAPQAISPDGTEWRYLSPSAHAALTVRFGAGGLVRELELSSYYPAPDAGASSPPPLDEATVRDLLLRYWRADWYERAEWLTTGKAAAHWREEMTRDPSSIKAEDWFPDEARLSLEQAGDAVLVRMEYVSSFTGKASTMTWRLEPVGGTWRIADWEQAGQWLP